MSKRNDRTVYVILESDFTLYGNQTRSAVRNIFREIGFHDFLRNWSRGSSWDASRGYSVTKTALRFLSLFRNNAAVPTASPQQVNVSLYIHGLILESVRRRWKNYIDEKILSVFCEVTHGVCWATTRRRTSRRFCCFRKGHRESMPPLLLFTVHLLLPGSPSPTPRNPQVAGVRAGYRHRLYRFQSPPGRRQVHRLSQYIFFRVKLWRDTETSSRFRFILSY